MHEYWSRIETRLAELGCLEAVALLPGASEGEIADLEEHLGFVLPGPVKQFLNVHNGQAGVGLMYGYQLLSVADIRENWDNWRSLDEEDMNSELADSMGSQPEGVIKPMYCNRAWIPLTHDWSGNHYGLDLDPDVSGKSGQIIAFGRDEDIKRLLAESFDAFIADYLSWLERAQWNGKFLDVPA